MARDRPLVPEARDQARRDDEHQRRRGARDSDRRQLRSSPAATSGGTSRRPGRTRCRTRPSKVLEQPENAGQSARLRCTRRLPALPRLARRMYTNASQNIQVEYVDVDREPARAREYDDRRSGTVVMEYDGRREKVMSDREQDLTNTLIKVTTGRQVKAYFVQGHGENDTARQRPHWLFERRRRAEARQLHRRQDRPRADAGRRARRCVGADHRRTDGRLPEARSRRDQDLSCAKAARRCSCSIRRSANPRGRRRPSRRC